MGVEIVERALKCMGRGFDATRDFRENYCKGKESLVGLSEETRVLQVPSFGAVHGVSVDVKCDKGERTRYQSDVLEFSQMSELINRRSSLSGKIPSGMFNSMFCLNGYNWTNDAAQTKCLALDGFFISLFNLRIDRPAVKLSDEVSDAVPSAWDTAGLARFIENYGTHVIVGLSVGGQDVVVVRQDTSSALAPSEIKDHLDLLGDQLFTGACVLPSLRMKSKATRHKVPDTFNIFTPQPLLPEGFTSISTKRGITVIYSKRGGDTSLSSHCEWLPTVSSSPDVINFSLVPITSLLKDVPGKGFLTHAINLYLRYKPSMADLQYFLEFQCFKAWAPILNDHPLGTCSNRSISEPELQFSLMGPRLRINTAKVVVGRRPVTGMRLHLEGRKNDRLAVHLHHLYTAPSFIGEGGQMRWRGSEEIIPDGTYDEAINWKMFSHVCTAPVEYNPDPSDGSGAAYFVAGAQLHAAARDSRTVLHLRLLFADVPGFTLRRSTWERSSSGLSQRVGMFSGISGGAAAPLSSPAPVVDSAIIPSDPPVPVHAPRLLKFVDTAEICKGPKDTPGTWLVTGARLALHQGKIRLHVKFSLLTPSSSCPTNFP